LTAMSNMTNCRGCGNQVHRRAQRCPYCDCPHPGRMGCGGCLLTILVVALMVFLVMIALSTWSTH